MKRILALILVLILSAGLLAGYGGSDTGTPKENHITTEEISQEMMEDLLPHIPAIAESAKYEFRELNCSWDGEEFHFLVISKECFSGVNDGNPWLDQWNLYFMDLDTGNVHHVKNRCYLQQGYGVAKADVLNCLMWDYEAYCTGKRDYLVDPEEIWTPIETEEDFAALQQRSACQLPEARNLFSIEVVQEITSDRSTGSFPKGDVNVMYVQLRNHAVPLEEYQQEWYAVDLDSGIVHDSYGEANAYYESINEMAVYFLQDVRTQYSNRVYDGNIYHPDYEIWDTMFDTHVQQLNEQMLQEIWQADSYPQPLARPDMLLTQLQVEGFSEYQNLLCSVLADYRYNFGGMENANAVSAMEYRGTIDEIGSEYHLLFLTTDMITDHHTEDDLVIDLNTGWCYANTQVDEGYPPMRYCEGIGALLDGYSLMRSGQQDYVWQPNEERTELLTPEECDKLNEAAVFTPVTEEEPLPEEETETTEETYIPEEDVTEESLPEEVPEEIPVEPTMNLPELSLTEAHIQQMIEMVNTYRQQDDWSGAAVIGGMLYQVVLDDLGHTYQLLLIGTDHYSEYPLSGILVYDLNTGTYWDESTAVWPQGDSYSGYDETKSVVIGAYAEYLLGNTPHLWTDMEQRQDLSSSQIDAINAALSN